MVLCAYYALFVGWFVLGGAGGHLRTFVSDAAYLPLGAAAVVLAARAAWGSARRRDRAVWVLLAVALTCRLGGDVIWWWLEAVQRTEPYPSLADVGFTGFYPLLIAALVVMPVRPQSRRASLGSALDVLAMVGGCFIVIWYLTLGQALQVGFDSLQSSLDITYPVWDVLLLLAAGRVVLRGSDPRWTLAARWLLAGSAGFIVGDVGFATLSALGGFDGGGWLDLPWVGALLCFALAAASPAGRTSAGADDHDRFAHLLPIAAILASFAVVTKVAASLPVYPAGGVVLASLFLTAVVVLRQAVAVAETRSLAARYQHAAITDPLTGLCSRNHFLQQAQTALTRQPGRCAAVMVDVDHFKSVNDQHGHQAGDQALQAVAAHLQVSARDGDLLARFGGDEFVALITDVNRIQAAQVVQRIAGLSRLDQHGHALTLSVGWACDAPDITALLARADVALYAAKAAGRAQAVAAHDLVARAPGQRTASADSRGQAPRVVSDAPPA